MPRQWSVPLSIALALVLGASGGSASADDAVTEGLFSKESIEFRQHYGFRHDDSYLRAISADPTLSSQGYDVPLTAGETQDMDRRERIPRLLTPLKELGALQPDIYGGVHIDQARRPDSPIPH